MNWLLKQLVKIQINLLSPHEGDVIVMWSDDINQTNKMAHDIADAKIINNIPILVLRNDFNMELLRNIPDELKEIIRRNL